jgi:hypothetical protein
MYPNDDDGDALQRLADDGFDMSRPTDIEFVVLAPNRKAADAIAKLAASAGYRTRLEDAEEDESWDCYWIKAMVPTYEGVVAAQRELDDMSRQFNGKIDGWGTFGNAADHPEPE